MLPEIEHIQNTTDLFTRTFEDDNVVNFLPHNSCIKMVASEAPKATTAASVRVHHELMKQSILGYLQIISRDYESVN